MAANNSKFKLQQQIDKCYEQRNRQLSARPSPSSQRERDEDARLRRVYEEERRRREMGRQLDAELMEMELDSEWR
jgi:hypothetical protein